MNYKLIISKTMRNYALFSRACFSCRLSARLKGDLLIAILMLVCPSVWGQIGKLFDAKEQLSSSFLNQVYLDNDGFIWVATRNGLNKYDGYQFHIYKKEQEHADSMASNYVNAVMQDRAGRFYLGMWGALQTYDGTRFYHVEVKDLKGHIVQPYVTCFLQRRNGEILAGTSGFGVIRFSDPHHAQQVGKDLRDVHTANQLMEDSRGHLWIITRQNGLLHDDGHHIHAHFASPQLSSSLERICEDNHGNIFVGTINKGLYQLKGEQFEKIEHTEGKAITALFFSKRQGKLFIGYDGTGLGVYNPMTKELIDNPYNSQEIDLSKGKINSITEDRSGNLWFGLLQKGLYKQPINDVGFGYMGYKLGMRNKIGSACVISTLVDSRGRIWIGTDKDGLYCMEDEQKMVKHFLEGFPATVMTIAEDRNGHIWIGSYREGSGWVDPATMQYHPANIAQQLFADQQASSAAPPDLSIFDICVDKQNRLWLATLGNGLLMMDQQTGKLKIYKMDPSVPDNPKVNSVANDYISQISISPDGKRVYAATTMGACCLDIQTGSWTSYFGKNCLNYGTPVRVVREFSKRLWIGTNDGLYCYDPLTKQLQQYTTEKGLADNGIASIEQDRYGRLWISTDHGLCCHDPKTGITNNYFIDNGLQSNEFSDGASWTTSDDYMLFGGVGGVTLFHPSRINQVDWKADVKLSAFTINGVPVTAATRSGRFHVTDTAVIASKRFDLGYHDNSFAVQLSTLTYDNPEHITYLYSINDEPFVRLQPGANEITFSHLSPGTYHFRVKAERNSKVTPERQFTVVVHSPWFRSKLAYFFYLLLLAYAIWQYLRFQKRKQQDRLRLQEHIHAEEMGEAKLRFFMNISHEIRTPMTLITTPLMSIMNKITDRHIDESIPGTKSLTTHQLYDSLSTIKRNAERILHLVNQMMDLRKIDKGLMQMHMSETNMVSFIEEIYTLFLHQAEAKSISLSYFVQVDGQDVQVDGKTEDLSPVNVWVDRGNFDKVIVNILSNAFKYTQPGGNIVIRLAHDEQNASIAISDDGEKIPEDKISKIFERFYQSPSPANDKNVGTGIGLDLARSLVELHYGSITARNLEQGCEFCVTIPMGNAHLKPEEMVQNDNSEVEQVQEQDSLLEADAIEQLSEPDVDDQLQETPIINKPKDGFTIVIAEDDDEIRNFLEEQLSDSFRVKACANGRIALAEALRTVPDLVISDVMMPEMDGNTLCSKLKINPVTSHIPFVMLTAKDRDEDMLEGLETGADAYISKPFNMDILRRTVINLIDSHRKLRLKYGRNDLLEQQVDEVKMKSPDEKLMKRVINTINKHLSDPDLSVDMIASEVGISRVHLHRKMKELTGQTPHDFIRNIRLKQAAHLLSSQHMNITQVLYACGFSNRTSFSTVFKNFYGMSPRDYMREHQK